MQLAGREDEQDHRCGDEDRFFLVSRARTARKLSESHIQARRQHRCVHSSLTLACALFNPHPTRRATWLSTCGGYPSLVIVERILFPVERHIAAGLVELTGMSVGVGVHVHIAWFAAFAFRAKYMNSENKGHQRLPCTTTRRFSSVSRVTSSTRRAFDFTRHQSL